MVTLNAGVTANVARSKWLRSRTCLPEEREIPQAVAYPATAKFQFGNGRMEENRVAADLLLHKEPEGGERGSSRFP